MREKKKWTSEKIDGFRHKNPVNKQKNVSLSISNAIIISLRKLPFLSYRYRNVSLT